MRYGIIPPVVAGIGADPDWLASFAFHAEQCGFESIVLVEHAVVASGYTSRYPYASSGRMPLPNDCPIPDPLDALAFLAGCTSRIGLATGVLVLPLHHPVVLAKRVATVDRLSGGRLRLCVGVGWMREELESCGVSFETRGRRTDEAIDAMRALWAEEGEEGASFRGAFFTFEGAHSHPKPWQAGGVPVHIGGHSAGLQPLVFDPAEVRRLVGVMRNEAEAAGRDPDTLELTLGGTLKHTSEETVAQARELGACRLVLSPKPRADLQEVSDELSGFAERMRLGHD